jgi:phospholipid/cholesterol/gamma-HCH transport system substrate-binding protein
VLALLALAGTAAGVLLFARVGALHGRTMRIYATVGDARGLSAGSEVWLGGQKIGVVDAITFPPPTADTTQRLLLALRVLAADGAMIRKDATVDLHAGGNFIGAPVVAIGFGAPGAPRISEGDTLRAAPTQDLDRIRADFASATAQLPTVVNSVKLLGAQLRAARGTLGAFGVDGGERIGRVRRTATTTMSGLRGARGTVGAIRDGELSDRARRAMATADSIRLLVAGTATTSLGRFRRDSTLLGTIGAVRTDLAEVAALLESPRGSAGRFRADSALVQEVARARASLDELVSDIKRNPLRYISF